MSAKIQSKIFSSFDETSLRIYNMFNPFGQAPETTSRTSDKESNYDIDAWKISNLRDLNLAENRIDRYLYHEAATAKNVCVYIYRKS